MLNNFVNFDFFFTKLSGIDPYEKRIDYPDGHAWGHVCMACSKLEAVTIYLVKQACRNDKRACVYLVSCSPDPKINFETLNPEFS